MNKTYTVSWSMDIDATDPVEVVRQAYETISQEYNTWSWEIMDTDTGKQYEVDRESITDIIKLIK